MTDLQTSMHISHTLLNAYFTYFNAGKCYDRHAFLRTEKATITLNLVGFDKTF